MLYFVRFCTVCSMYRRRRIEQILHGARALGGGVRSIDESCFLTHDEKI